MRLVCVIILTVLICSCVKKEQVNSNVSNNKPDSSVINANKSKLIKFTEQISSEHKPTLKRLDSITYDDHDFVALRTLDSTFLFDMRYATANNFLNKAVYECDQCLLRYKTIKQLIKANIEFKQLGYKIKFYDCYRPLDVQQLMWDIYPDARYVANPKKGSNHNRGTAVDITLVDSNGVDLPMGTDFDFFGRRAHHNYTDLPVEVLNNRNLLKSVMEKYGFWSISSEWWHYNLNNSYSYEVSNFKLDCND